MPGSNVLASISMKARRAILRLSKIRAKYDLTIDEALIIVAVAECNFSRRSQALAVAAAPVLSIAEFLNTPYETTRRRMVRLRDRGLLAKVGFDGYMVADLGMVRELVDLLGIEAGAAEPFPAETAPGPEPHAELALKTLGENWGGVRTPVAQDREADRRKPGP